MDLFFVQPDIYESIFRPFGIEAMPVIEHKTNATSRNIVQLVPQGMVELKLEGYPSELCPDTNKEKYTPVTRGSFPSLQGNCDLDYVQSKAFFGSGHSAFRATIISALLYKKLTETQITGVDYTPLAL